MLKTSNQAQLNDYQLRIRETTQIRCNAYVTKIYYTAYSTTFILLPPFHNNNILWVLNKPLSIHSRGGLPYWGKVAKFWLGDANFPPQIFLPDKSNNGNFRRKVTKLLCFPTMDALFNALILGWPLIWENVKKVTGW